MKTNILVPLDGSPLAERALDCAQTLGDRLPATLVLLRTVSIPTDAEEILSQERKLVLLTQLEKEAHTYLAQVADRLENSGLDCRAVVVQGPAAEGIVAMAEEQQSEFIVMATHGYSGIRRWTRGSVAERVLQAARVPVVMLCAQKGGACDRVNLKDCRRILIPLDGSTTAEQVLPPAIRLAKATEAEICLLRISIVHAPGEFAGDMLMPLAGDMQSADRLAHDYLATIAAQLQAQQLTVTSAVQIGSVASTIIEYAESQQVDLIAMCTHGRTGLVRWVLGSVADRVLRAVAVPLLLVRTR